jgi:hypothetical protein
MVYMQDLKVIKPRTFEEVTKDKTHKEIIDDVNRNVNKSKFSFLLKYDQQILKDLDVIQDEVNG